MGSVTSFCTCGILSGGGRGHQDIRLVCKSLDRNGGKWVSGTLLVVSSTHRAISQTALQGAAFCASVPESELLVSLSAAVYHKETPCGLDWLRTMAPRGKRPAPLEPLSSFWLGTNTWSLVMSFARRQQLKSSGRALLPAVRSHSACECPVHHLHCKLWQVPLPAVSDLMTCRVITRNYFFKVTTQHFYWKCVSYHSSWVKTCSIAKYDVYAPVILCGFNIAYTYFQQLFISPCHT